MGMGERWGKEIKSGSWNGRDYRCVKLIEGSGKGGRGEDQEKEKGKKFVVWVQTGLAMGFITSLVGWIGDIRWFWYV